MHTTHDTTPAQTAAATRRAFMPGTDDGGETLHDTLRAMSGGLSIDGDAMVRMAVRVLDNKMRSLEFLVTE